MTHIEYEILAFSTFLGSIFDRSWSWNWHLWTDCKSLENLETKDRHVMSNPLWLISNMRFWLFRPFWGQFLTLSGHDMHRLWIVRIFWIVWWATRLIGIESYAYYVYLAVFQIYDPKMTLFDPLDDRGRPWDAHHWI